VLLESKQKLKIGDVAPGFDLLGVDGKQHTTNGYRGAVALLVVFMCNHCPYVQAKFATMNSIANNYRGSGLAFVGINPNNNPDYPDDSFENMKKVASQNNFAFDYLFDGTQGVARDYGAVCTPDPFLFAAKDEKFILAYHGRFDDALNPGAIPATHEMQEAIEAVLAGKNPEFQFLPSRGCSIKWVEG